LSFAHRYRLRRERLRRLAWPSAFSAERHARGLIAKQTALLVVGLQRDGNAHIDGVVIKDFAFKRRGLPFRADALQQARDAGLDGALIVEIDGQPKRLYPVALGAPGELLHGVDRWDGGSTILRAPYFGRQSVYKLYRIDRARPARLLATVGGGAKAQALFNGSILVGSSLCRSYPDLCGLKVTSTINEPDLDKAVDIVLVGDGYTDMAKWRTTATNFINTFKGHNKPGIYQTAPELFNFHVVEVPSTSTAVSNDDTNDTALGMRTNSGSIKAHGSRVSTAALNAPDSDIVVAVANSSKGRANAYFPSQAMSGSSVRMAGGKPAPLSHEFGHAMFSLHDEYTESSKCTKRSESNLYRSSNVTVDSTCYKFKTTSGAGCVQGAVYCKSGIYRSASGCLMRASGNSSFCPVCKKAMRTMVLERLYGRDLGDPWAVIAAPQKDETISGKKSFSVYVFDYFRTPSEVAFVLDGSYIGTKSNVTAYAYLSVDTTQFENGPHELQVFVTDSVGHSRASSKLSFIIDNSTSGKPACKNASDCDDADACTTDSCNAGGSCEHKAIKDCCNHHVQCDDGDPCKRRLQRPWWQLQEQPGWPLFYGGQHMRL
jgi:hypothetical protein